MYRSICFIQSSILGVLPSNVLDCGILILAALPSPRRRRRPNSMSDSSPDDSVDSLLLSSLESGSSGSGSGLGPGPCGGYPPLGSLSLRLSGSLSSSLSGSDGPSAPLKPLDPLGSLPSCLGFLCGVLPLADFLLVCFFADVVCFSL